MNFNLAYGQTGFSIELPDYYNVDVIEPSWINSVSNQSLSVTEAIRKPYNSRPLKEIAGRDAKVAIIFSDITRATPYNIILPALLNELQGIPRENICFFCANGTHRQVTDRELTSILGEAIFNSYEIIQNDANDPDLFTLVGKTSSGNDILINKKILGYDLKILTGFIEPHFFAGFSGGGKALVPGLASEKTIKVNHSIANLSKENVNWGITSGNPVWEEITEAAEFIPGLFLLNITLNKNKEITNVFAGDLRTAHRAGSQFAKESAMVPVSRSYDIVITSNSGYPLDLNIYQTVKGMHAAAQIVKKGGSIIMAAECWDGIPPDSDYEKILTTVNKSDKLMDFIIENEFILKDTWQIYYQALIQKKSDVYLFSDKLDESTIRRALFKPVADIAVLVDTLVKKAGSEARICILPEGPQTIPYLI